MFRMDIFISSILNVMYFSMQTHQKLDYYRNSDSRLKVITCYRHHITEINKSRIVIEANKINMLLRIVCHSVCSSRTEGAITSAHMTQVPVIIVPI